MRSESGKIEGDLRLDDGLKLSGMVTGDIEVVAGGALELSGMCCRNLTVRESAVVNVHGYVVGDVVNDGGLVIIYGTVRGDVRARSGSTTVDANAVVQGNVMYGS